MKRVPLMYKTDEVRHEIALTSRSDKFGNILHCVEYPDSNTEDGRNYVMFSHLSSALDFIQTNFKA